MQRVSRAAVRVDGDTVGEIGPGLLALVGVTHSDGPAEASALGRKLHELRILRGERSVADTPGAAILVVSQFTVYGDARKGRRPTWQAAAAGATAEPLIDLLVSTMRAAGATVATGMFGADMEVELVNDGPITLVIDI